MASVGDYESAPDATGASWVVAGLRGFAESVLSLVPAGFDAYGRIFHPAGNGQLETPVTWRAVAEANGKVAHPAMQWASITGSFRFEHGASQPGIWDSEPEEGSLSRQLLPALVPVLERRTRTPERCWFAVWDGYGSLAIGDRDAPAFDIPHRRLLLLTGPITAVYTSLCTEPWWQSPSLWWPDDRAWCVETEVDLMSTYVGGTRDCIADLVACQGLEAMAVQPADGVAYDADRINPLPADGP